MPLPIESTLSAFSIWFFSVVLLPMIGWTLIAYPCLLLLGKREPMPAPSRYAFASALFYALPASLILSIAGFRLPLPLFSLGQESSTIVIASPATTEALPAVAASGGLSASAIVGILLILLAFVAVWRIARLVYGAVRVNRDLRSRSVPANDELLQGIRKELGVSNSITLSWSQQELPPLTIGWLKPLILVPPSLKTDEPGLRLAIAHEWTHIRHYDFLRRWIDMLLSRVFFFHPLVHRFAQDLIDFREMACDAEVLHQQHPSKKVYAELLYRCASTSQLATAPRTVLAMQGHDFHQLKNRITAMYKYNASLRWSRPANLLGSLLLLFTIAALSACSLDSSTPPEELTMAELAEQEQQAIAEFDEAPKMIGGLEGFNSQIKYPVIAKKAGIEGRVVVQFKVNLDGTVSDATVLKGIGAGCDEEVLRVLSETTFEPALKDGQQVAATLALPVMFKLPPEVEEGVQ